MPTAIVDTPLTWLCTECKKRVFNHVEFCQCGQARPTPEAPKQPTDTEPFAEEVEVSGLAGAERRLAILRRYFGMGLRKRGC